MNIDKKICYCTNLTHKKLKTYIFENSYSLKKIIDRTKATHFCGCCTSDLVNYFFYYKYLKKICKEENFCLFK